MKIIALVIAASVLAMPALGDEILVTTATGVGEYTTSGTTVNAHLITTPFANPVGIAVSGSNLFVMSNANGVVGNGKIAEYTTSGTLENANFITGLSSPISMVVSGSNIFVASVQGGTVGEYTTSGATVNASLIAGLNLSVLSGGTAVSGSSLFIGLLGGICGWFLLVNVGFRREMRAVWAVTSPDFPGSKDESRLRVCKWPVSHGVNRDGPAWRPAKSLIFPRGTTGQREGSGGAGEEPGASGSSPAAPPNRVLSPTDSAIDPFIGTNNGISEYTTSGTLVNPSLIPAINATGIAVSGSNLFVTNIEGTNASGGSGTIGEYTTSGETVNASLVSQAPIATGLFVPIGIAVDGPNLFVADYGSNLSGSNAGDWISEYTTAGATVGGSFINSGNSVFVPGVIITGLSSVWSIAIVVPEPSSMITAALGLLGLVFCGWRRRAMLPHSKSALSE